MFALRSLYPICTSQTLHPYLCLWPRRCNMNDNVAPLSGAMFGASYSNVDFSLGFSGDATWFLIMARLTQESYPAVWFVVTNRGSGQAAVDFPSIDAPVR
ncbi:hypothetical protein ACP70R_036343 [Stipagrostis hirtigluma subsp. patula]